MLPPNRRLAGLLLAIATILGTSAFLTASPAAAAVVTPNPATWANTATAQLVTVPVGATNAALYSTAGGATTLVLTGPGSATTTYSAAGTVDTTADTVTGTFDMVAGGVPAGPGSYALAVDPKAATLPLDTGTMTITATQPAISSAVAVQPGRSVPFTVTATTGKFAAGATVSFTASPPGAAGDLSASGVTVTGPSISGSLTAIAGTPVASYNLVVTDTAGGTATCTGCVKVDTGPAAVTNLAVSSVTATSATATWTAPSSGPTVTGYTVVVSTNSAASTTDAGITVTQTTTGASATISGLTAGPKYFVAVSPKSASGPGKSIQISFFATQPTTLTLGHSPASTTYPGKLTLSGNLSVGTDGTGMGIATQPIDLFEKSGAETDFHKLTAVSTDADGNYSYAFSPKHNAAYVATYAGSAGTTAAGNDSSAAPAIAAQVAPEVTLTTSAIHASRWLKITGKVRPKTLGTTVTIYNTAGPGRTVFARAVLSATSKFALVDKHVKSGHYRLVAKVAKTASNLAGLSAPRGVTKP